MTTFVAVAHTVSDTYVISEPLVGIDTIKDANEKALKLAETIDEGESLVMQAGNGIVIIPARNILTFQIIDEAELGDLA